MLTLLYLWDLLYLCDLIWIVNDFRSWGCWAVCLAPVRSNAESGIHVIILRDYLITCGHLDSLKVCRSFQMIPLMFIQCLMWSFGLKGCDVVLLQVHLGSQFIWICVCFSVFCSEARSQDLLQQNHSLNVYLIVDCFCFYSTVIGNDRPERNSLGTADNQCQRKWRGSWRPGEQLCQTVREV